MKRCWVARCAGAAPARLIEKTAIESMLHTSPRGSGIEDVAIFPMHRILALPNTNGGYRVTLRDTLAAAHTAGVFADMRNHCAGGALCFGSLDRLPDGLSNAFRVVTHPKLSALFSYANSGAAAPDGPWLVRISEPFFFLRHCIEVESLAMVEIPYPIEFGPSSVSYKRLVTSLLLSALHSKLCGGGTIRIVTDNLPLARFIDEQIRESHMITRWRVSNLESQPNEVAGAPTTYTRVLTKCGATPPDALALVDGHTYGRFKLRPIVQH